MQKIIDMVREIESQNLSRRGKRADLPANVALISDTHLTSPAFESYSIFPSHLLALPRDRAELLYESFRVSFEGSHEQALFALREQGPYEALFHLGDLTNGWQEKGLAHPSVRLQALKALERYRKLFPKVHIAWGNHDTGYGFGGLSHESLIACDDLSPLFWKEDIGGVIFIGVCSPLAAYEGRDTRIISKREAQRAFVTE